jgi:hypothetical protein
MNTALRRAAGGLVVALCACSPPAGPGRCRGKARPRPSAAMGGSPDACHQGAPRKRSNAFANLGHEGSELMAA